MKNKIQFEACLKSSPSAKCIKFDSEGDAEIIFETDASQMANVLKLLTLIQTSFKITIEEVV